MSRIFKTYHILENHKICVQYSLGFLKVVYKKDGSFQVACFITQGTKKLTSIRTRNKTFLPHEGSKFARELKLSKTETKTFLEWFQYIKQESLHNSKVLQRWELKGKIQW